MHQQNCVVPLIQRLNQVPNSACKHTLTSRRALAPASYHQPTGCCTLIRANYFLEEGKLLFLKIAFVSVSLPQSSVASLETAKLWFTSIWLLSLRAKMPFHCKPPTRISSIVCGGQMPISHMDHQQEHHPAFVVTSTWCRRSARGNHPTGSRSSPEGKAAEAAAAFPAVKKTVGGCGPGDLFTGMPAPAPL